MKALALRLSQWFKWQSPAYHALQRLTLVLTVTLVYGVIFMPLHFFWGDWISLISLLPVILTGWFFGTFIGICSSLAVMVFNAGLWALTKSISLDWQFLSLVIINLITCGLAGYIAGQVSESRYGTLPRKKVLQAVLNQQGWTTDTLMDVEVAISDINDFFPGAMMVVNRKGQIISWNPAMESLTNIRSQDILGKTTEDNAASILGNGYHLLVDFALGKSGKLENDCPGARWEEKDLVQETFFPDFKPGGAYVKQKARPIYNLEGIQVGAVEYMQDVTDLRLSQERQSIREQRDPVTGLSTQQYLEKQIGWIEQSQSYPNSILLVRLKTGPETGRSKHTREDDLLRRAAVAIQSVFRAGDTIAYTGGRDFAILAPKADANTAQHLADRLRKSLNLRSLGRFEPILHFNVVAVTSLETGTLLETFQQGRSLLNDVQ